MMMTTIEVMMMMLAIKITLTRIVIIRLYYTIADNAEVHIKQ